MSVSLMHHEETLLFHELPPEKREAAKAFMVRKPFSEGELICGEGDSGDTMYFIEKGEVEFW